MSLNSSVEASYQKLIEEFSNILFIITDPSFQAFSDIVLTG